MNIDKSVFGILSILVAVIVVATVAIPVIEDSQSKIYEVGLNTNEFFTVQTEISPIKIDFVDTTTGTFAINGVDAKVGEGDYKIDFRLFGDTFYLYIRSDYSVLIDSVTESRTTLVSGATLNVDSEGAWTLSSGSNNITGTTTKIIYTDPNGTYGYYSSSGYGKGLYITKGNTAYLTGSVSDTSFFCKAVISESGITDADVIFAIESSGGSTATESVKTVSSTITTTPIDDNNFSLKVTSAELTADGVSATANIYLPIEYKSTTNESRTMVSILSIIPLLLLIVPVMMVVRMYSSRGE